MGNGTKPGWLLTGALCKLGSLILALVALALVTSQPVFSQATPDQTLFGPKQYLRTASSPDIYTDTFTVPQSIGSPFVVRIVNGDPNGANRLSSAWIKVNGVQIAGPADFGPKVGLLERTVSLSPTNTLEVRTASGPDGFLTITVFGTLILPVPTSLAPNPLTITAGATGSLTATLAPAPTSGGSLTVVSANASVASVPASVAFAAGQTQVAIPVTGVSSGSTSVTASLNGGSATATVNVNPAPVAVTSLAPASLTLTQGATGTLTVTISAAQAADVTVALTSSDSGVAFVPSGITVPAGAVTASVTVNAVAPGTAQITATLNASSASSQVTVTAAPPTVVSLVPVMATVTLGANTSLTLTISAAQTTDTVVPLAVAPAGIISVPESVVVRAGQTTATVPVATFALGQAGVTAALNGTTASSLINVVPPPVAVTALEPETLTMTVGATSSFTVRINSAQLENTEITLSSSNPGVLTVPASVIVAQGTTSAVFTVTAAATGDATITASANNTSRTSSVHVAPQPAAIVSLLPSPLPLQQGSVGTLTVTINVAQEVDTVIALANSDTAIVQVPSSVTVVAGAVSATIPVTALTAGFADVIASVNGTSATSRVEVTPPPPVVTVIEPATLTLPKGTPGVLRVFVSRAPNVATAVALSSSNSSVAQVPATVNVPAGSLFADFAVASLAEGQATITASLNGGSAAAVVTVTPAELVMLTLSPAPASAYIGETVQFTASGTLTDGTTQDFTTRVAWSSTNGSVATISSSGVASALAEGLTTIIASYTFTAAQTGQSVTITASTTFTVRQQVGLILTAPTLTLQVNQSTTVTVSSSDPAPTGGLLVSLAPSGTGSATFPSSVTIAEGGTSATFTVTGVTAGQATITATAANRLPGSITFTIQPLLAITSFTPASGPVGTAVAISGFGFNPVAANNQVRFNGQLAVIVSGNATTLNAIVPLTATTGPISVTNNLGTAVSATPFTVQDREAFDITLAPETTQLPPGANGATRVRLTSTGLNPYPYAAALTVSGLPSGVTAAFDRPTVALNQDAILALTAQTTATAGSYPITVTAVGQAGVTTVTRSKTLTLVVPAAGGTSVTGRVLHAEDGAPFVGARVRLATAQTFTDESGTYRFINPPVTGDQVLLIDGSPANSLTAEYPSGIPMPVMIVAGQDNKPLTVFIGRVDPTKFTSIVPGTVATVTNPDIPNLALNIPQGVTITGWDGQPVDRINVRVVPVDRLPIRPIPAGQTSRFVYLFYFFREGGGTPTQPIPITLPNDVEALPGTQVEMWYYDEDPFPNPNSHQWRLMGMGTVSADGKSVVSNPGVGMPKFCCGAARLQRPPPGEDPGPKGGDGGGCNCGNPVDAASGNASVFRPRPFGLSKIMPVDPSLQYRSKDNRIGLFGRGMTFSYDWFAEAFGGSAVRVTTPDGVQYMLSLEADGKFRARSGRSGALGMEITPTASGRTLKLADGMQYDFNTVGRLVAMRDLNGNQTSFTLDANGFPTRMTDATSKPYNITLTGSAPNLNISRITDPIGRVVDFEYDASRRLIRYTDQGAGLTQLEYDAANRIRRKTDSRGAITDYEYDAAGRATREVLPGGAENRFSYSVTGATVTETRFTDANGNVTTYRFNGLGYETSITDALGRVSKIERDPVNNLVTKRTDPAGRVTQFFYNARGDLIRTVDADNRQTLIDYDIRFRKPTRIENALGHVTTMVYDAKGNLTSLTNAENETATFTYTPKGQLETVTDPLNRITSFTYDASGNVLTATNPANETVRRSYDIANRMAQVTDALNRSTTFTYDNLDRVTEVRDAAAGFTRFAFDANDNLLSVTDPNNNPVERNIYDLRNRLTRKTDAKNLDTVYVYDGVGNVTRITDRKGQVTEYRYDIINRIIEIRDADGRVTTYDYDLAGNMARISDTQTGDILMAYDSLNRMTEVVTAQGTVQYAYDAIGRRTSRTISGGDVTTYSYDKANRVKTVTTMGRTATYNYDQASRLTSKVLPNGIQVAHQYDNADRVTNIAYTKSDSTLIETVAYTYDAGGQRVSKSIGSSGAGETPFTATYDEANRMTSITLNSENFMLAYDSNGNLTSRSGPTTGTTTYTWNARNQLASISGPIGTATFKYDALGRRMERTVNGDTTGFLYDGIQAIVELRGSALDTVYHTGLAIDEVLARYGSSGNRTLLTDALMSVIVQTNDDQSVANFYSYSAFGQAITLGPDGGNDLQYAGLRNDRTGLYHAVYRYFDPVLKQWTSEDPIGIASTINLYTYVGGDPISNSDPLGLHHDTPGGDPYPQCGNDPMCRAGIPKSPAPPPPPKCEGQWEQIDSIFAPGLFETLICKCRWACKCGNRYTGQTADTLGVPGGMGRGVGARMIRRPGQPPKQELNPKPNQCYCVPPQ